MSPAPKYNKTWRYLVSECALERPRVSILLNSSEHQVVLTKPNIARIVSTSFNRETESFVLDRVR